MRASAHQDALREASSSARETPRQRFKDFNHISETGRRVAASTHSGAASATLTEDWNVNNSEKCKIDAHGRKLKMKQRKSYSKVISTPKEFSDLCSPSLVGGISRQESVVLFPEPGREEPKNLKRLSTWKSVQDNLNIEFKISQSKAKHHRRKLTSWGSCSALQVSQSDGDKDVPRRIQSRPWSSPPEIRKSVSFELPKVSEVMRYPPEHTQSRKEFRKSNDLGNVNKSLKKSLTKGMSKNLQTPMKPNNEDPKLETSKTHRSSPLPFLRRKISGKKGASDTASTTSLPFLRKKKFDFDTVSSIKSGGSHLSEHLGKLGNLKVNLHMRRSQKIGEPMLTGFTKDDSEFPQPKTCTGDSDSHSIASFTSIESSASTTNKIRHSKFRKRHYYDMPNSTSHDFRIRSSSTNKSNGPMKAFKNMLEKQSKSVMDLSVLERASSSGLSRSYDDILKENNFPTQEEFMADSRFSTLSHEGIEPGDFDDDVDYYRGFCSRRKNSLIDDSIYVTPKNPTSKDSSASHISKGSDEHAIENENINKKIVRSGAINKGEDSNSKLDLDSASPQMHCKITRKSSVHDIILKYEAMEQIKGHFSSASNIRLPYTQKPNQLVKSLSSENTFVSTPMNSLKHDKGHFSAEDTSYYERALVVLSDNEGTGCTTSLSWAKDCKSKREKQPVATPRHTLVISSVDKSIEDKNQEVARFEEDKCSNEGTLECLAKCDERKDNEAVDELHWQNIQINTRDMLHTHTSHLEEQNGQLVASLARVDSLQEHQEYSVQENKIHCEERRALSNRSYNENGNIREYKKLTETKRRGHKKRKAPQKLEEETNVETNGRTEAEENKVCSHKLSTSVPHVIITTEPDNTLKETEDLVVISISDGHKDKVERKVSESSASESTEYRKISASRMSSHEEASVHSSVQHSLSASSTEDSGFFNSLHRLVMKNNSVSSNEEQPSLKKRIVKKLSSVSSFEDREITDETLGKVTQKPLGKKKTPPKRPPPPKLVFDKFNTYNQYLTADTASLPQTPPPPKPPRLFQILSGYRKPTDLNIPTEAHNYRRFSLVDSDLDMIRSGRHAEDPVDELVHEDSGTDAETDGGETYTKFTLEENSEEESLLDYPLSLDLDDTYSLGAMEIIPDTLPPLTANNSIDLKEEESSAIEASSAFPPPTPNNDKVESIHESLTIASSPDSDNTAYDCANSGPENDTGKVDSPFPVYSSGLVEKIASPQSEYDNLGSFQSSWSIAADEQSAQLADGDDQITSNKELLVLPYETEEPETNTNTCLGEFFVLQENPGITLTKNTITKDETKLNVARVEKISAVNRREKRGKYEKYDKIKCEHESSKSRIRIDSEEMRENAISALLNENQSRKVTASDQKPKTMERKLQGFKLMETLAEISKLSKQKETHQPEETNIGSDTSDFERKFPIMQFKGISETAASSSQKDKNITEETTYRSTTGREHVLKARNEVVLNFEEKVLHEEAVSFPLKTIQSVEVSNTYIETNDNEFEKEKKINSCRDAKYNLRESPTRDIANSVSSGNIPSPIPVPAPRVSMDNRPTPTPRTSKPSSASSSRPTSAMSTASERPLLAMFFEKLLECHANGEARRLSMSVDELGTGVRLLPKNENKLSRSEGHIMRDRESPIKRSTYENVNVGDVRDWKLKTSLDSATFSDGPSVCDSYKSEASGNIHTEYSPTAARRCVSENELMRGSGSFRTLPLSPNNSSSTCRLPLPRPRPSLIRSKAIVLSSDEDDLQECKEVSSSVAVSQESHRVCSRGIWVRRASDSLISEAHEVPLSREDPITQLTEAGYSGDTEDDDEVGGYNCPEYRSRDMVSGSGLF